MAHSLDAAVLCGNSHLYRVHSPFIQCHSRQHNHQRRPVVQDRHPIGLVRKQLEQVPAGSAGRWLSPSLEHRPLSGPCQRPTRHLPSGPCQRPTRHPPRPSHKCTVTPALHNHRCSQPARQRPGQQRALTGWGRSRQWPSPSPWPASRRIQTGTTGVRPARSQ